MKRPFVRNPSVALLLRHRGVQLAIAAMMAATAAVAVALLAWRPVAREHTALETQIAGARRGVVEAQQARALLRAYQHAAREVEQAERKLSAPASQAQLVTSLEHLAEAYGVRLLGQSYEEGRRAGPALRLSLKLEAGYPELRAFLADLPTLRNWVEVEEARIERSREDPQQLRAQLRLALLREAEEVAP